MRARVFVTLKPSVFDPQGKTIADALHSLGYISEAVVKQAVSENQANLLQEYVDPLDWANNQSSFEANQAYTYLLGLYELKRWSPPIA